MAIQVITDAELDSVVGGDGPDQLLLAKLAFVMETIG